MPPFSFNVTDAVTGDLLVNDYSTQLTVAVVQSGSRRRLLGAGVVGGDTATASQGVIVFDQLELSGVAVGSNVDFNFSMAGAVPGEAGETGGPVMPSTPPSLAYNGELKPHRKTLLSLSRVLIHL